MGRLDPGPRTLLRALRRAETAGSASERVQGLDRARRRSRMQCAAESRRGGGRTARVLFELATIGRVFAGGTTTAGTLMKHSAAW